MAIRDLDSQTSLHKAATRNGNERLEQSDIITQRCQAPVTTRHAVTHGHRRIEVQIAVRDLDSRTLILTVCSAPMAIRDYSARCYSRTDDVSNHARLGNQTLLQRDGRQL